MTEPAAGPRDAGSGRQAAGPDAGAGRAPRDRPDRPRLAGRPGSSTGRRGRRGRRVGPVRVGPGGRRRHGLRPHGRGRAPGRVLPRCLPEEALAYFGRKFDELAGQVDLLEQRVRAGGIAPKDAGSTLTHLREAVTEANAVGDLAALLTRLDAVATQIEERRKRSEAARAKAREAAAATKERIVEEAEKLLDVLGLEAGRRPAARAAGGVEEGAPAGAQGRRRAVEAVQPRAYRLRQATPGALRGARRAARRGRGPQGEAHQEGRGALDLEGVGRHGARLPGPDDRVEGRRPRPPGRRGQALGAVPGRPGRVLRGPLRGVRRAGRRPGREPGEEAEPCLRGRGAAADHRPQVSPGRPATRARAVGGRRPRASRRTATPSRTG